MQMGKQMEDCVLKIMFQLTKVMIFMTEDFTVIWIPQGGMQDVVMESTHAKGITFHRYLIYLSQEAVQTVLIILVSIAIPKSGNALQSFLLMLFTSMKICTDLILVTIVVHLITLILQALSGSGPQ